jgi:nitrogen fixation protein FixH
MVTVHDRDGEPISDAQVSGDFLRPSNSEHDFPFALTVYGAGTYVQDIQMSLPGIWRMVLRVQRGEDSHEVQGTTQVAVAADARQ